MLSLAFSKKRGLKVLCLGAHCDDIEIGCGGTVLKLAEQYPEVEFYWVVFASTPERGQEAKASAEKFLEKVAHKTIIIKNFRDGFLPYSGLEVKEYFEQLKKEFSPELIFTHYRNDLHQDHRLVNELTWNTFRDHLILEYEIPKWDGDMGQTNVYVPVPASVLERKIELLMAHFGSQRSKQWFDRETFRGLARLRGMECRAPEGYAEAFFGRKLSLG